MFTGRHVVEEHSFVLLHGSERVPSVTVFSVAGVGLETIVQPQIEVIDLSSWVASSVEPKVTVAMSCWQMWCTSDAWSEIGSLWRGTIRQQAKKRGGDTIDRPGVNPFADHFVSFLKSKV